MDDRKLDVLRAIVEDYVSTQEPVGSKALVERHHLGVSPATVRNDMAVLEEEGFITQPHTSAGRIPTDKGYRLFVDRLTGVKPLTPAERRAISTFLEGAVDLDDVVQRTVRMLAQLTRQVAIVQYPSLARSSVRHVELVTLSETRLLLVLITSTGRVEQRVIDLTRAFGCSANRLWLTSVAIAGFPGYCAASNCRPAGVIAGLPALKVNDSRCLMNCASPKKNNLFLTIGPPNVPPNTLLMNLSRRLRLDSDLC